MANVARAILIVFIIITISGCKEDKACVDVKGKFKQKGTHGLLVFVDATQSMVGFVHSQDSTYSDFIKNHLSRWSNNYHIAGVYGFGDDTINITDEGFSQLTTAPFYRRYGKTFLSVPLQKVIDNSFDAFVIISDMVISPEEIDQDKRDRKREQERARIRDKINTLSQDGYSFKLIGIQSDFIGSAYSERRGCSLRRPNGEYHLFNGQRPFYLLIGYRKGSEPKSLADTSLYTKPNGKVDFMDIDSLPELTADFKRSGFQYKRDCKEANEAPAYVVKWEDKATAKFSITMKTVDNMAIKTAVMHTQTNEEIPIDADVSKDAKNHKTKVTITMQRDKLPVPATAGANTSNRKTKGYSYYAIDLIMKYEKPKTDGLVATWSTQDDSDIKDYNKTFGLQEIADDISAVIVKPLRFYLIIENQ
ncbi:MAG: hypothetical protein HQK98_06630 [Nitrospirae bacterium]|nr:hypothetical protein [Nitrospirota bacterium]